MKFINVAIALFDLGIYIFFIYTAFMTDDSHDRLFHAPASDLAFLRKSAKGIYHCEYYDVSSTQERRMLEFPPEIKQFVYTEI